MAIKKYKPVTNGRRNMTTIDYSILTHSKPEKSLTTILHPKSGRNNQGVITTRHKGGGHKKRYRHLDFKRNKDNIKATISSIEYDPNRNAFISLLNYHDGEKRYILYIKNTKVGDVIESGDKTDIKLGNCMQLRYVPDGTFIHNIEMKPFKGGQIARSAGSYCQLIGRDDTNRYVIIKMTSGEVRKILSECRATIGMVGNEDYRLIN